MSDLLHLFLGTLWLRPYVFGFLAVYLLGASREFGLRRTLLFTGWAWVVAFVAEFSSSRGGIPFGLYHYTEVTRGEELYLANVPVIDPLSFPFLAYASFSLARRLFARSRRAPVIFFSGVLMMLLDVVIDPLAVRGDRWFLGRIFYYPEGGVYFGVPLSNFAGWAIIGWLIVGGYSLCVRSDVAPDRRRLRIGVALYYGVLALNLIVTWGIGELLLLVAGLLLHAVVSGVLWYRAAMGKMPAGAGAAFPGALHRVLAGAGRLPLGMAEPAAAERREGGFGKGARAAAQQRL